MPKTTRRRSLRPAKLLRRPVKSVPRKATPAHLVSRRIDSQANSWRTYIIVLVVILIFGAAGSALAVLRRTDQALGAIQQVDPRINQNTTVNQPDEEIDPINSEPVSEEIDLSQPFAPATLKEPFTVLLIGVDKRAESINEGVRSDTLILVRVNPLQNWATMLSIPRDSVAPLPDGSFGKVNRAFSYGYYNAESLYGNGTEADAGGGAAAAETLERFLKIKVDYIAQVDFQGFERIVDSIGGITVDVKQTLIDPEYPTENHGVERIYIPAGLQIMDGRTSLIYARSRHASNDFDRSKRQQQVLKDVLRQVRSRGLAANMSLLPKWVGVLEQNVRTTLPIGDISTMSDLAGIATRLDSDRIAQFAINPSAVRVEGVSGSDIYWNEVDIRTLVNKWQSGADVPGIVNLQVLNGSQITGVAGKVTNYLTKQGYATVAANDGTPTSTTILYDIGDHLEERTKLVEALSLSENQIVINSARPQGASADANMILVVGSDYDEAWTGTTQ
ncbi:MAG: LCP family protein [Roseiflexaceae bacterium]